MAHLPTEIILVLAPCAPLFSERVWRYAQVLLVGAMLNPGVRTVTATLRVMGLATERHFTNDHRVLNRATWSARHGSQMLLGVLLTLFVPPGATIVLGDRGGRWVRRPAQKTVGLLAHRPVGPPHGCLRSTSALCWWQTPRGNYAWRPSSVRTCRRLRADPAVGRHALVGRGHL
jgi:hypothetical protein